MRNGCHLAQILIFKCRLKSSVPFILLLVPTIGGLWSPYKLQMIHSQLFEFITNQHKCDQIQGHSGTVSVLHPVLCKTYHSTSSTSKVLLIMKITWFFADLQIIQIQPQVTCYSVSLLMNTKWRKEPRCEKRNSLCCSSMFSQQSWIRTKQRLLEQTRPKRVNHSSTFGGNKHLISTEWMSSVCQREAVCATAWTKQGNDPSTALLQWSKVQTSAWPRGCVGPSESCAWTNAVKKREPKIWHWQSPTETSVQVTAAQRASIAAGWWGELGVYLTASAIKMNNDSMSSITVHLRLYNLVGIRDYHI